MKSLSVQNKKTFKGPKNTLNPYFFVITSIIMILTSNIKKKSIEGYVSNDNPSK